MPRYEDSPRDRSPIDRRDGRRMKSPSDRRRGREGSPMSMSSRPPLRDPYDDYPRMKPERDSPPYKILCVANLNHKVSDAVIRDALLREFGRFGEVTVKVCHDSNERIAYIYFRSYEDAREARHAKARLVLFDKVVEIDPIFERAMMPSSSGRRRSLTPDYGPPPRSMRGPPSPNPPSSRRPPPPPPPPPPPMRNSLDKHGHPMYPPMRGPHNPPHQDMHPRDMHMRNDYHHHHASNANRQPHRESKKEKFPNYLHHIPPEDDDKATRTLFVGNLEVAISEADLRRIFERYGVVEDIDVKRPPPGQGNAYAFIKFLNLDMAHRAKVEMSGQYIGKFQCKIGYGKATPTTRIWVGGLGNWTSLSHLEREFDRFGAIRKIDFVKGDNHAYIQYDSIDAAQAACQEMRGNPLGGPDKRLRVDFADPGPYSYYNSPSRNVATSGTTNEHYNAPNARRSDSTSSAPDGNWPTPNSRYHGGAEYGDNFGDRANSRGRPSGTPADGFPPTDADDQKRDRGDYNSSGSGNANWNWWDEGNASPSNDRRGRRPRTPEGEERKKPRRSSMSPDAGGDQTPSSPRRSRAGAPDSGARSPSFDNKSDDRIRNVIVSENVTAVSELVRCCPLTWNGGLILKNSAFPAKMLLCSGDSSLVEILMKDSNAEIPMLRITQRLRLDPMKLEDVSRRMTSAGPQGYCMLLTTASNTTLQASIGEDGGAVQTRPLRNLVSYLKQKDAAGVISLSGVKDGKEMMGVLYAFPPCPFALELLRKVAPNLSGDNTREDYLVVIVIRGTN
ncbi:putative RNA-binding protein 15-like protein [Dinothrombium tinctorium]|uniref:Putative RNA-binding protein 15-like protein n=1 Tax=Dinothrombium tinctorium TaxID=1965070 RepID=A0A3S3RWK5_9ACAR|nr:putative RNA-binding protein 15-like protein [Dinothrombium tinctorium]RWS09767.1 putative RNA-binding protein 15-like protein [Dinothrombium tinctorium]